MALSAPLNPQRTMDRNAPCWCGSNLKWKKCHRRREDQPVIMPFEMISRMKKAYEHGTCLHPGAGAATCHNSAVRSHTIQRRGGLSAISENGHVLTPKIAPESLFINKGKLQLRRLGIGDASTFPGFCEAHDGELFRPIERNAFKLSPESAFIFSYRSIAYETFFKAATLKTIAIQREADRGRPFEVQAEIQQILSDYEQGTKMGEASCRRWKADYDECIRSGDLGKFRFFAVELEPALPIAACGAFYPEYDFQAQPLQDLLVENSNYEHVAVNITTWENRGLAVFGWFDLGSGAATRLVTSLQALPSDRISDALTRLCFEHLENIYIRPSAWAGLRDSQRNSLLARVPSGGITHERPATCLVEDGHRYWVSKVTDHATQM